MSNDGAPPGPLCSPFINIKLTHFTRGNIRTTSGSAEQTADASLRASLCKQRKLRFNHLKSSVSEQRCLMSRFHCNLVLSALFNVSHQVDDSRNFVFTVLGERATGLRKVRNCAICYGEHRFLL